MSMRPPGALRLYMLKTSVKDPLSLFIASWLFLCTETIVYVYTRIIINEKFKKEVRIDYKSKETSQTS